MAEHYCEPYERCTDLDGRLLIARTISGPALAMEEGQLPFGSMSLEGGSLHPYARIAYNQQWTRLQRVTDRCARCSDWHLASR
jgi:hypothetical protein